MEGAVAMLRRLITATALATGVRVEGLDPAEWAAEWRVPRIRFQDAVAYRDGRGSGVAARLLAFYLLRTLKPSLTMRAPRVAAAPLSTPLVIVS